MAEKKKNEQDTLSIESNEHVERNLDVPLNIFETAKSIPKHFSNAFIKQAIAGNLTVDGKKLSSIREYLDVAAKTEADIEIIADPKRIAGLYELTTAVIRRNLRLEMVLSRQTQALPIRQVILHNSILHYLSRQKQEIHKATAEIIAWCADQTQSFPTEELEYHGFNVEGKDILDSEGRGIPNVRPNFQIQRQFDGVFVMAYTNRRIREKLTGRRRSLDRRIYLNPDMEATPLIFEQLLRAANASGIALQLKMFQRASEAATAHSKIRRNRTCGGLRGDGIVVYVAREDADSFLKQTLHIVWRNSEAFEGRHTSRIPYEIDNGIAIGDEPLQAPAYSLTSHRTKILENAANIVRKSGKQGEEACELFRRVTKEIAELNGVNPDNIAFNK